MTFCLNSIWPSNLKVESIAWLGNNSGSAQMLAEDLIDILLSPKNVKKCDKGVVRLFAQLYGLMGSMQIVDKIPKKAGKTNFSSALFVPISPASSTHVLSNVENQPFSASARRNELEGSLSENKERLTVLILSCRIIWKWMIGKTMLWKVTSQ